MKFYHVEKCKKEVTEEFNPRIPESRLDTENGNISRICVSSSIAGCLGAVPWGGRFLADLPEKMVFRIYEFDEDSIKDKEVLTPKELVENGYVPDALAYEEYWVLENIKPSSVYYILVDSYEEESEDFFKKEYYKININDDDFDFEDYYIGCCTVIGGLEYSILPEEDVIPGNVFEMDMSLLNITDFGSLEEIVYDILGDYISSENHISAIIDLDTKLIIKTFKNEGLHYTNLINDINEVLTTI